MLDAAEDASPFHAVEAVTDALAKALGEPAAFFLIADISGRGLVRLSHGASDRVLAGLGLGGVERTPRRDHDEQAVGVPFDGGPAEEALRTQTMQVLPTTGGSRRWAGHRMGGPGAGDRAG